MNHRRLWRALLALGIFPFVLPILIGLYRMQIESWTLPDWLVLYSFLYWPTYLVGLVLILLSAWKLFRSPSAK